MCLKLLVLHDSQIYAPTEAEKVQDSVREQTNHTATCSTHRLAPPNLLLVLPTSVPREPSKGCRPCRVGPTLPQPGNLQPTTHNTCYTVLCCCTKQHTQ